MILVAGATGVLGSEIVRRLRAKGENVRAIVRSTSNPDAVAALESAGVETAVADLKNPSSLDVACRGVEAVISGVTAVTTAREGDSFAATDGRGNKNLIDAAVRAGAKKFVFVSFNAKALPAAPLSDAKVDAEQHLKESGINYTILHPSYFCESWLGPMLFADPIACTARIYGDGNRKIRYVAVGDVAELAVQSLTNPAANDAVIPLGGPEEISQREAVEAFEKASGRKFALTELSEESLEAQWQGATDPFQRTFAALMLGVARGFDSGTNPVFDTFPMKMTSAREWIEEHARPS
jgi:uncharacterized protein YbjT (DUF2867 family)